MTPNHLSRLLLLSTVCALSACAAKPVPVPPELSSVVAWLRAHPPVTGVLTLSDTGAAAIRQAGGAPFLDPAGQTWLLAHDAKALQTGMTDKHLDYLLTTEPDLRDVPALTQDKAVLVPSVLRHLQSLYGTGTHDQPCVDGLQLVTTSATIREVGGRHLPAALLFKRVPGALLRMSKLVPGIPVRVETTRRFAGQVFVFDCQSRADAQGNLTMRFPYPALAATADAPAQPVRMWTAMNKVGEPIEISAEAVEKGTEVNLTE